MLSAKKRKSVELGHWDAVKANDSNRNTTESHQAFGLIESETYYVLITWPGPRDFGEWLWKAATSTSCHCFPFLLSTVDFNSLSIGLCQGMRHNFYATVCLWFQRFATQEQGNEKWPKLPLKSNTLKAFTWGTGKLGAKIEKYKTCKWSPQDECGKLRNQEEQWKTNELQIFGSWSCY